MSKQAFDKKLEALESLRADPAAAEHLRKALRDRNNFLVSKAAAMTADLRFSDLTPDLIAAFDHFLIDPVKSDPQCWAKNAIVKALKYLGHRGPQVFLKGLVHVQMEPVWGGRADSAGTLRGTCALALVDCQLDDFEILSHLVNGLADPEQPVRIDTAVALSQLGRPEGALLLRLKALLGDSEPEVLGQCFYSLLSLTPQEAVPFVGKFLASSDENIQIEAASALAQSREPEAMDLLKTFWKSRLSPELRRAFVTALGASPQPDAGELLLSILTEASDDLAAAALRALLASRFREELRPRITQVVDAKADPQLKQLLEPV